jgi:hypothetical protein
VSAHTKSDDKKEDEELYGAVSQAMKQENSDRVVERVMAEYDRAYEKSSTEADIEDFDYPEDEFKRLEDSDEADEFSVSPEDRYSESASELEVLASEHGRDITVAVFIQITLNGVVPRPIMH